MRVPVWAERGFTVKVNGVMQKVTATPGRYVTIDRVWKSGDKVDIGMPLSFRAVAAIDDKSVQSIFYGPTLLTVQAPPLAPQAAPGAAGASAATAAPNQNPTAAAAVAAASLEAGLIKVALYKHMKLNGDFSSMMTPIADKPLHFTANGQTFAPLFVADPQAGQTQPYHMYFRRHEPSIVFGGADSGVINAKGDDGVSFLDAVWSLAPFANHERFVAAVLRTATAWNTAGRLTDAQQKAIVQSARRAQKDLV
jgi:uncharacterized protein